MRRLLFLSLSVLISISAFGQSNDAGVMAAVKERYKEWLAIANKKDADAMTNLYDENAILLPKSEEPVFGKAAIDEYYKKLFANPNFVPFTLNTDWNSFHATGDVALATSIFEGEATRNERLIRFRGKFMMVWKKETDGSWKIFRYMYDEIPTKK